MELKMTNNLDANKLSYVIVNNTSKDFPLEPGETWKFIVKVEDQFSAYNQMAKCKSMANKVGHDIMNVYLDGDKFNPRGWYTDGVNEDNITYNDNIKIDNLTDETKR
tara:strand:+ start:114 stop:434 length:321 start_codon:yes stop_codon:yes gene_type:complete